VGREKRRNVERLKEELRQAWEVGGVARNALRAFLEKYV
jgi:hypothetical protein